MIRPAAALLLLAAGCATVPEHRICVLVERRTWEAANERFGSFGERFQQTLDGLHELLDTAAEPVLDRFHVDRVVVYDREEGARPTLFDVHPEHDLVIACDEGGPLAGFWLPAYSIGHNFRLERDGEVHGLWSDWGEQALWHEIAHYRGVPDYYISRIPAGNLPGFTNVAIELPSPYREDTLNSAYQPPRFGLLASKVMNAKAGVTRVGACEEPDQPHGHMWRWLPERLVVEVTRDGMPLEGATVQWWSSRPGGGPDPRVQKADRADFPDGTATADAAGRVTISGDYLNREKPRPLRSLWLLVEAETDGEHRFGIVYGLWLNERWATGRRAEAVRRFEWERMTLTSD